ncbi:MAG TPA: ABC transporter permease [Steroidobacteraceae bacterium]|jgi:ABC-2 type transport system permease protein|nr:ABC transporter permease [Steroidobacteraceae bacterium]
MKPRRVAAIAVKELLQVWRDPRSLLMALLMPLMQMLLLGYGMNLDIKHVPTCLLDLESSQFSDSLAARFRSSEYFEIVGGLASQRDIPAAMDHSVCRMALVIPVDFSRQLNGAGHASVQAILDATDDNSASLAAAYANAVVSGFSADVQMDTARRYGSVVLNPPVQTQSRVWFNEDLASRNFIIPGVVALILALVGAQLSSLTVAREWERGTMEMLLATPVTRMELMIGKLAPYFLIGLLDAVFCLAFALLWFGVPFRGSVLTLLFTTSLFLVVVLGIGYFLSVSVRSQVGASQLALLLTIMPISLLSGYAFAIDQMPPVIQGITYVVYARYFVTILKALFLKGSGALALWAPILGLVIYAVAVLTLAARSFRRQLG